MGCNGSKATQTENQNGGQQQQTNEENKENDAPNQQGQGQEQEQGNEREAFVTEEEAIKYVSDEFGISSEKAAIIVKKVNKNDDGKIANKELVELWNKIKEKKDAIRPKFEAYDKDKSGTVSVDEAYDVLKEMFNGIPESHVRAMITRFDGNNTGRMSFNEFIYFYAHVCAKKERILARFGEIDKDGSGVLSADEVSDVIMDECALEKVQALSLVQDFDANKDDKINRAEFETLFVKLFP